MSYFAFGGYTSEQLGLIITRPMIRPTWQPETEFTPIIGRARLNPFTKSYYNNIKLTISAVITDAARDNMRLIYNVLRGYGALRISTAENECVNAYCRLPVPEPQALLMAELPIEFECVPFAYDLTRYGADLTEATSYIEINNRGTVFTDPEIRFCPNKTSTVFDCNGKTITVTTPQAIVTANYSTDYSVTLDCDGEIAYYTTPAGANIGCTELTNGSFPRLNSGRNVIKHNGITEGTMLYYERYY